MSPVWEDYMPSYGSLFEAVGRGERFVIASIVLALFLIVVLPLLTRKDDSTRAWWLLAASYALIIVIFYPAFFLMLAMMFSGMAYIAGTFAILVSISLLAWSYGTTRVGLGSGIPFRRDRSVSYRDYDHRLNRVMRRYGLWMTRFSIPRRPGDPLPIASRVTWKHLKAFVASILLTGFGVAILVSDVRTDSILPPSIPYLDTQRSVETLQEYARCRYGLVLDEEESAILLTWAAVPIEEVTQRWPVSLPNLHKRIQVRQVVPPVDVPTGETKMVEVWLQYNVNGYIVRSDELLPEYSVRCGYEDYLSSP